MVASTSPSKVLVVDDDPHVREVVEIYLGREGFRILGAQDGEEALRVVEAEEPDVIVLDLMLPGRDGWDVCREIRRRRHTPIIMLTARGEEMDKVLGLELGADDYLTKPFSPRELAARVKAILRRMGTAPAAGQAGERVFLRGMVCVDLDKYQASVNKQPLTLSPKEFELLWFLAGNPGRAFTREQLLEKVWGYDFFGDSRTVDVHVKRLRGKLGEAQSYLQTVWGVGYKFEASE